MYLRTSEICRTPTPRSDDERVELVGRSRAIERTREVLRLVARSDAPVLITGETGTGKELAARLVHQQSQRADRPFVAVNCAVFPESLIESELFGYVKGAFTGAQSTRQGRFLAAHTGTLLLDEVGELPLTAQAKLLRVLQEGTFEPLGTNEPLRVDVRVISATHRDLRTMIAKGQFREDLYYRLHCFPVELPPLRERTEDIAPLAETFLARFGAPGTQITEGALRALEVYPFPGNVRELENIVRRSLVFAEDQPVGPEHLPPEVRCQPPAPALDQIQPLADALAAEARRHIVTTLRACGGHRRQAAAVLQISRKSLWEKMRHYDISDEEWGTSAPHGLIPR